MGASDGEAVLLRPDRFDVSAVLAAARGLLGAALERCGDRSDAALEICAAWEALDEASTASSLLEPRLPAAFGARVLLAMAQHLLFETRVRVDPLAPAARITDALTHLDAAAALMAGDTTCDGPPWA